MSHFYGTLKGSRGVAIRFGTKGSGLTTYTACWTGAVKAMLYHNEQTGRDMALVELVPWQGRGLRKTLYAGEVSGYDKVEEIKLRLDAGEGDDEAA